MKRYFIVFIVYKNNGMTLWEHAECLIKTENGNMFLRRDIVEKNETDLEKETGLKHAVRITNFQELTEEDYLLYND